MLPRPLSCAVALGLLATAARAQQVDVTLPPRARSSGGSFVATAAGATLGAAAGFTLGLAFAPLGQGACAVTVPGGCGREADGRTIAFVAGSTVLGATGGAILGRHMTHGKQSVPHTFLGAVVGLLTGVWIATQLRLEEPVPTVVALSIPTGFFAALSGW
jgi:hypothetical protein